VENCQLEEELSLERNEELITLRKQIKVYNYHKEQSQQQRKQYAIQKQNLEDTEVTIVGDYSENIELNLAGRQQSQDFYNKPQRSLLCFVVHSKDKKLYFDFISDDLSHSSGHIYHCYCKMVNSTQFKELNVKKKLTCGGIMLLNKQKLKNSYLICHFIKIIRYNNNS